MNSVSVSKNYFTVLYCNLLVNVKMTYVMGAEEHVPTDDYVSDSGYGRGRFFAPSRGAYNVSSPAFCSTRLLGPISPTRAQVDAAQVLSSSAIPDLNDPALNNLITHIAQQVGQTIMSAQQKGECEEKKNSGTHTQSTGASPSFTDTAPLNLTGVRLVMQSDVREPPTFRGDGSDKYSVHEWEEFMNTYLRKRGIPLEDHYQEIMTKLMGKARDIVKITLRSSPTLKPHEDPKVIMHILKQHFSEMTYSCMPLADFYGTVPLLGENPVDYWVRLNQAVDAAEEGLRRLGRNIEDPCREVTLMFVKHCPDPSLAAVLKFKAPEKWTAGEIQEYVDRYQTELRGQMMTKPGRRNPVKDVTAHVQSPLAGDVMTRSCPVSPPVQAEVNVTPAPQFDGNCMKTLISLLDRALAQNNQAAVRQRPPDQSQRKHCKVCKSAEHSTLSHCMQERLCLSCFEPGHIKRNCPNFQPRQIQPAMQSHQGPQPLN